MSLPPGPRSPALYQSYRFITKPAKYCRELRARYGDLASFRVFHGRGVVVMSPEYAREVFAAPSESFDSPPVLASMFGATAVIAVGGERHKRLRKLLNPRFHGAQVRGFLGAMTRAISSYEEVFARAAKSGEAITMLDVTQAMALDIILETVFGAGELDRDRARTVLRGIMQAFHPSIMSTMAIHKPWFGPWRRLRRARDEFEAWAKEIMRGRREGELGSDVLGVLLAARDERGDRLDDDEMCDQLLTLLLAGHETSATALAWAIHYLAQAPEVVAKVRTELDASDRAPETIVKLPYLDAVIYEALRIEPIITDVFRVCREPFAIGEHTVPAGDMVAVMLISILLDERVFPEPTRFRPERFLEKRFSPAELLPFGGGSHRCLGSAFAEAELSLALAEMVGLWDFTLAPGEPEYSVRRNLTMGPKHGVRVHVKARASV